MFSLAWYYAHVSDEGDPVTIAGDKITVADGDSFSIGNRKFRLNGIDAPEYRQTCTDEAGQSWDCGKAARGSLEKMLLTSGLACTTTAQDRYARAITSCSANGIVDIGGSQVRAGFAISHEFYGIRDYGDEEDEARSTKRGIWRGRFTPPAAWRETHSRPPK